MKCAGPFLLLILAAAGLGAAPWRAADVSGWVTVPPPSPEAVAYAASGRWIWIGSRVVALLLPLLFLCSGAAQGLEAWITRRAGGRRWLVLLVVVVGYLLFEWVMNLPLGYLRGYLRPHWYGLSTETLGGWLWKQSKFGALQLVFGTAVLGVPFLLMGRWPRRWWLANAFLALPGAIFLVFVQPIFVAPLFHDYGRMRDTALEARILALAARAGVEEDRVFEVNRSHETRTVNAFVSGLGSSRQIVLWDTLVDRLEPDGVVFVMGHELGHHVLHHLSLGLLLSGVGFYLLFGLVHFGGEWLVVRYGPRLGISTHTQPAAVPLFVLLVTSVTWLGEPVALFASRHMEHEADRFALELTQDNRGGAKAFVALQQSNLSRPWPAGFEVALRYTHPPLGARVDFCNRYRPWARGEPQQYKHLFSAESQGAAEPQVLPATTTVGRR